MASPECLICTETPGLNNLVRLGCSHYHCHACLSRQLDMCIKSTPFQPARCCQVLFADTIRSFPTIQPDAVREYRSRLAEFQSPSKLYCHAPACRAFIPRVLRAGRSAKCRSCQARTCCKCGAKAHFNACVNPFQPRATEVVDAVVNANALLFQLAKRFKWKRCPECRSLVSKVDGCNHIRCLCGCDFCYRCGRAPYNNHGNCAM